jgi:hypothetical protein
MVPGANGPNRVVLILMRNVPRNQTTALLATVAIALFAYFVAALLLLHVLKADYTVVDHMISDYAVGRFGWIMTTAFTSIAIGCLLLGIGMLRQGPPSWLGRLGAVLLLVVFAGLVVTAIFPTDLETAPSTPTGDIHALSFFVNIVAILLSAVSLGLSYGGDEYWRRRKGFALGLSAFLIVAFVAQFFTLHRGAPYGITNRAFVAIMMCWLISTALWLRQIAIERS